MQRQSLNGQPITKEPNIGPPRLGKKYNIHFPCFYIGPLLPVPSLPSLPPSHSPYPPSLLYLSQLLLSRKEYSVVVKDSTTSNTLGCDFEFDCDATHSSNSNQTCPVAAQTQWRQSIPPQAASRPSWPVQNTQMSTSLPKSTMLSRPSPMPVSGLGCLLSSPCVSLMIRVCYLRGYWVLQH